MKQDRPLQARSIATREKLIHAALDVIFDVGYENASTTEFSKRAGVSRGALLHHFPARSDIMVAAMETLLRDGTAEIREMAVAVSRNEMGLDAFIEWLQQLFSGRFFYLSVEFINGARTDPDLRARMIPVVREFHEALDGIWSEFCEPTDLSAQEAAVVLNMTLCLVRGMGIQTVLREDPAYFHSLLEAWKAVLPQLMKGPLKDLVFPRGDGSKP
ncbi:MAG: TetR/AcrR family transcriptional regulator [Rhodobacteraceae bacterium]|uniref:Transcriptional regulator n=1 Tax=Salipiger profundus TaxID=1229727 RepID=A0A1U7D8L2_9RHOB|nr:MULTISPECIES: TetR/AcrR family transcriptional regulator [Salipiger]APX24463.1 transcriptional regulator [Salipiger profundus]MAB07237.1 TetR/AcrR family transcriptional regulator [Paracoccaceae bacterium]GGA18677.1 TetR family transcriptional regulator [Salipiger profundus]SFD39500.1 transcriptional regulator, TetR family [Salipiger profundus]